MIRLSLLVVVLCLGVSRGVPVDDGPLAASCSDPVVLGAANQAMDKINKDRTEGYVFALKRVVNAHSQPHGESSVLFYLTMSVQETNCSVVSGRHFKNCEVRDLSQTPVYGQCKAAIFISRVHRVVRLYNYNCVVRPMAAAKIAMVCPDCPTLTDKNRPEVQTAVTKAVEKFNKESGLAKYFKLLEVARATSGYMMMTGGMAYYPQFSIQETTCANGAQNTEACPLMDCEFAHKGFCQASHIPGLPDPSGDATETMVVNCEIFEPQAAEEEKKLHALGAAGDHSHDDTQVTTDHNHGHQHTHAGHSHTHSHSHGHGHAHGHHDNAHDHSNDRPNQHHQYQHAAGVSTHDHDHEMALDHAHNHSHLHEHEHHHHHHHGAHQPPAHKPEGAWRQIPPADAAVTLPAFPDVPAGPEAGVTLPAREDPQIPGQMEPRVGPSPSTLSPQCPPSTDLDDLDELMAADPEFRLPA